MSSRWSRRAGLRPTQRPLYAQRPSQDRRIGQSAGHNGNVPRSPGQRRGVRAVARRLLCRRDDRRVDLVRHAGHRQHRASRLHHSGLLHRLHRQHDARDRSDPGERDRAAGVLSARRGGLSGLLRRLRASRRRGAARPRVLLRPAVHHRGHARAGVRRGLPAGRGAVYRSQPASRHRRSAAAPAGAVPGRTGHGRRAAAVHVAHVPGPSDPRRGAGPARAAADGGEPDPHQAHRLRPVDRHRLAGRRGADRHPAGRAVDRPRLYRPRVRHLRAGRHGQLRRHTGGRDDVGNRREPDRRRSTAHRGRRRWRSASCWSPWRCVPPASLAVSA